MDHDASARLHEALQAWRRSTDGVPGVLMRVERGDAVAEAVDGERWVGGEPLQVSDGFRTASVTKTFTASAVLCLVDRGLIGIDDPLHVHLPAGLADLVRAAITPDVLDEITVRRTLNHTAGFHDFGHSSTYGRKVAKEPSHVWTAEELVGISVADGILHAAPGTGFHYSDTGFTLLAGCVEHHTGQELPAAFRSLLHLDALGLTSTWLERREDPPVPAPVRVHQHLEGRDTYDLHPSCDGFGGGGLVSTCGDLARFVRALLAGEVVPEPLLTQMLDCSVPTDLADRGAYAGWGIFRTPFLGTERLGHEGFWGVWMFHYPELDLTVTGTQTAVPLAQSARDRLFAIPLELEW